MKELVIGLDCTGETYSCGLLSREGVFTSITGLSPRRALLEIPSHVSYLLKSCGASYRDVAAVGVTKGPGSFTGVRLGITLAKTIAFASQCKIFPMDTLELLARGQAPGYAQGYAQGKVAVALDARRGELYCGIFKLGEECSPQLPTAVRSPALFTRDLLNCEDLRALVGPGFAAYPELVVEGFRGPVLTSPADTICSMSLLCDLSRSAWQHDSLAEPETVEPVYHRKADIQVSSVSS